LAARSAAPIVLTMPSTRLAPAQVITAQAAEWVRDRVCSARLDRLRPARLDRLLPLDRLLSLDRLFPLDRLLSLDRLFPLDRLLSLDRLFPLDQLFPLDRLDHWTDFSHWTDFYHWTGFYHRVMLPEIGHYLPRVARDKGTGICFLGFIYLGLMYGCSFRLVGPLGHAALQYCFVFMLAHFLQQLPWGIYNMLDY
jgi:hypothetical protein